MCEGAKKKKRTENRRVRQNKCFFYRETFCRGIICFSSQFSFHFLIFSSTSLDTDTHWRRSFHFMLFFLCWWQCDTFKLIFRKEIGFFFRPVTFHSISRTPTHLSWETREAREGRVRFLLTVYRFSMIRSWTNRAVKKKNLDLDSCVLSSFGMKVNRQQQETLVGCFLFSLSSLRL